jgi:predicted amidophosphoribosyltransferase
MDSGEHWILPCRILSTGDKTQMYCSTCGGTLTPGLSYCNHCGARLGEPGVKGGTKPAELFPDSLIWAIVTVFIMGLGGTIALTAVMKDARAFEAGQILGISFFCLIAMLAVEAVLVYVLLSRRSEGKEMKGKPKLEATTVRDLKAGSDLALPEPPLSVTDHTTRTLEPVYRERQQD